MEFLLKIVEGAAKGAEIALLGGRRVKVGSSDDCDIVLPDTSFDPFELDVSESAVTFIGADGTTDILRPLEVKRLGTSAFAVGPAEGKWGGLVWPKSVEEQKAEVIPAETVKPDGTVARPEPEEETAEEEARGGNAGCGCIVVLFLLLAALALPVWCLWPRIREALPEDWRFWEKEKPGTVSVEAEILRKVSLAEIARQNGLDLTEADGVRTLKGNLRRKAERMAIIALARAEVPSIRIDLTDDESLLAAVNDCLFGVTEGALKATGASNRVVTVTGFAPTAERLEHAIRTLNADVPQLVRLETSSIQLGGTPPKEVSRSSFVDKREAKETTASRPRATAPAKTYPIAGVMSKPYPCVVLRDGQRLTEGAQIGSATIVRIEVDKLTFREGKTEFVWKP